MFEITRQKDLVKELRRQVGVFDRHLDQCRKREPEHERQVRERVAAEILGPRTLTNAEMADIDIIDDPHHVRCVEVYMSYAARVARGEGQ